MLSLIHAIWNNLFASSVFLLAGLFLLALTLTRWEERRKSQELLELCTRLREQRRRERLQGGQLEKLTQAFDAVTSNRPRRTPGFFKGFRRKLVWSASVLIAVIALVRNNEASDRSAPARVRPIALEETSVSGATNIFARETNSGLLPVNDSLLQQLTLKFDYDHACPWEAQTPVDASDTIVFSEADEELDAADPSSYVADPGIDPMWVISKPVTIPIRGKK